MSCGLPLELFQDAPTCVQRLDSDAAEHNRLVPSGDGEDAAEWVASLTPGYQSLEVVRPVTNRGPFVYWIRIVPTGSTPADSPAVVASPDVV